MLDFKRDVFEKIKVVESVEYIKRYIWYEHCKDCIAEFGLREDEDFDESYCYEECCGFADTKEILETIEWEACRCLRK